MNQQKNKVEIRICGKDYTIIGTESEEYIQKIALYIDKKMKKILESNSKLSTSMAAILTSINIGDDYFKTNENLDNLRKQVKVYAEELDKNMAELEEFKKDNDELNRRVQTLQLELVKKETEFQDLSNRSQ